MLKVEIPQECCYTTVNELFAPREIQEISPFKDILGQVVNEIIGTKRVRNGCRPTPEVEVSLRNVVRSAIEEGRPVPILVPFGSSKQGPHGCDLAEAMALLQLKHLEQKVQHFYKPGIEIRIRLEDATDEVLFDTMWVSSKTGPYCSAFTTLSGIILPRAKVILESDMVDYYNGDLERIQGIIHRALVDNDDSMLEHIGWLNGFPTEQISYYRDVYKRYYPSLSEEAQLCLMARYFSCAVVRKMQDGTGATRESIILYFGNPVPGLEQMNRVFYKTNIDQHTHRAPWLGKGYIDNNHGIPYVSGWDGDGEYYEPGHVVVSDDYMAVQLEADYVTG